MRGGEGERGKGGEGWGDACAYEAPCFVVVLEVDSPFFEHGVTNYIIPSDNNTIYKKVIENINKIKMM